MPKRALTMGVGTILESRRCVLLATGAEKADILARAVEGPDLNDFRERPPVAPRARSSWTKRPRG